MKLPNPLAFDLTPMRRAQTLYGRLLARCEAIAADPSLMEAYVEDARWLPVREYHLWINVLLEKVPSEVLVLHKNESWFIFVSMVGRQMNEYTSDPKNRHARFMHPVVMAAANPAEALYAADIPDWLRFNIQEVYNYATAKA